MIPYGRQDITEADIAAIAEVLRSDFLTQGPAVPAFEEAVARHCGAAHAIAVNSATSALHIACLALDVGPGDWVWTSPITFVASANCARYCGAQVDFVDIDPDTYNMSAVELEIKLENAKQTGKLPKVVIPVHLAGQSCDMAAIHGLSRRYGFRIIEDASHAIGGTYRSRPVGSCEFSDITVFSFHPVKIITTAEGGMAVTNSDRLAKRLGRFRSHGITRDSSEMTHASDGPWYYQQIDLGLNYRMTDIQAALGLSQMQRLNRYVSDRHERVAYYNDALKNLPLVLPYQRPDTHSAFHLYIVLLALEKIKRSHRQVFEALREQGVGVNLHYIPVHRQPYYEQLGFHADAFPAANHYYARAISLPMYATLSKSDQETVVAALARALAA